MRAWFGERVDGRWVLAGTSPEQLAGFAAAGDSSGIDKSVDLSRAAIEAGFCHSFSGYRKLLHETAMSLARDRIAAMLATEDADIVQAIRSLDTAIEAFNEMSERIVEWYGIHHPRARLRPHELIDELISSSPGADVEAMQGYAACARALHEERKRLETFIAGRMEDVAPNLSAVLGPLLGARLIAKAGGLEKLAKLPASALQVMGAREALFRHLREGTPPPKHGFIYRHPLVSGSPKRLRGRISRVLAGKAAIAARVDFYSGGRAGLEDEVKRRVAAIKGGRRVSMDER